DGAVLVLHGPDAVAQAAFEVAVVGGAIGIGHHAVALANAGNEVAGVRLAVVHFLDTAAIQLAIQEKALDRIPVRAGKNALAGSLAIGVRAFIGAAISHDVLALALKLEVEIDFAEILDAALFGAGALQRLGNGSRTGRDDAEVARRGDIISLPLAAE